MWDTGAEAWASEHPLLGVDLAPPVGTGSWAEAGRKGAAVRPGRLMRQKQHLSLARCDIMAALLESLPGDLHALVHPCTHSQGLAQGPIAGPRLCWVCSRDLPTTQASLAHLHPIEATQLLSLLPSLKCTGSQCGGELEWVGPMWTTHGLLVFHISQVCSCPQVTHAEPQRSCSKVTDSCQHICQCRPPPPLPPPPPPPPPPRLLSAPGKSWLLSFPGFPLRFLGSRKIQGARPRAALPPL